MAARSYLLDTSVISQLIRQPQGAIAARIAAVGEDHVVTSSIVACELRFGAAEKGSRRLTRQVEAVLAAFTILPLERGVDRHYGAIRAALERTGTPIGANDLLIAAHARAIQAVCVTGNLDEFGRVPGLRVENWLE